jgi:hypothetical protein
VSEQFGWRFCDKCFGMFFNGDADPKRKGRCPAGDGHHAQGFVFKLPFDVPAAVGQPGWSFCDKCFGMFFDGDRVNKGRCPAGAAHNHQGFAFVLPHDVPAVVGQPGWSFCDKCFGMFFDGDRVNKGRCPAGAAHNHQGFAFVLPHIDFPHPSITLRAVRDPGEGNFVEVVGIGFTPHQSVKIGFELFSGGAPNFHQTGADMAASDGVGGFIHRIRPRGDLGGAQAEATDLGSGEVVTAELG